LRNYKINSPKFAEILNERSKADDVITHAPGVATTSAWRCGTRRIAPKQHEELRLWLGEMKEEEEGEVEEEEEEEGEEEQEEEQEEQEKGTGDEVAEFSKTRKARKARETKRRKASSKHTKKRGSASLQQARSRRQAIK
jgi:hypothetical protein